MDRRAFIRRMVAAGVSAGAALSYAELLAPDAYGADAHASVDDFYPEVDVAVRSGSLAAIRRRGFVKVRVRLADPADVVLRLKTRDQGSPRLIGKRRLRLGQGTHVVRVPLNRRGRRILAGRNQAVIRVLATAADLDPGDAGVIDRDQAGRQVR